MKREEIIKSLLHICAQKLTCRKDITMNEKIRQMDIENSSLSYRIKNELEPRIASERRAYDRWVTNPERQ